MNDKKKLPSILYRYRDFSQEHDFRALMDRYLWFSSKEALNDPFEYAGRLTASLRGKNRDEREIALFLGKEMKLSREEIRRYLERPDREWILRQQDKWWRRKFRDYQQAYIDRSKVCCFAEQPDLLLMWGHYGNGLKGVVLGYDTEVLLQGVDAAKAFIDVEYPEDNYIPVFDCFDLWVANQKGPDSVSKMSRSLRKTAFGTKAKCWSYENEWRLVLENSGSKISYNQDALKEVIFGELTPDITRRRIRKALSSNGQKVSYKEVRMQPDKYELKVKQLKG